MYLKACYKPWLFSVTCGLFMLSTSCQGVGQKVHLSVPEFAAGVQQPEVQVLDVRTAQEYNAGHLAKAFQADWNNRGEFAQRIAALDKQKPIYAYCLSGARSAAAVQWLTKQGFKAYNLNGGIYAWQNAGKPIEAPKKATQISLQQFEAMIPATGTVLVDFGATWCPPCKKMEPIVEALHQEMGKSFTLLKIDGGTQTALCQALQIPGFPTFIVYKNGKQVWRHEGLATLEVLRNQLK